MQVIVELVLSVGDLPYIKGTVITFLFLFFGLLFAFFAIKKLKRSKEVMLQLFVNWYRGSGIKVFDEIIREYHWFSLIFQTILSNAILLGTLYFVTNQIYIIKFPY